MRINVTGAALATLLVFCTGFKASAQGTLLKEARYEVNLTVGIVPGALVSSKEFPNSTVRHNHDLYYFYEPYYSTGMFPEVSMDANIILKKWLKVGGKLGYYTLWGDLIDPKTHRTIGKKRVFRLFSCGSSQIHLLRKASVQCLCWYSGRSDLQTWQ